MQNTDQINRNAIAYNDSVAPILNNIAKPLYDSFGFTQFSYLKMMPGTRYLMIATDADTMRGYYSQNLDQHLLLDRLIIQKQSKLPIIWDLLDDNPLLQHMRSHGYYHGLSLYHRGNDSIEAWHFAVDKHNSEINNLYMQNLNLLEEFICYFQAKAHDLIDSSEDNRLSVYKDNHSFDLETFVDPAFNPNPQVDQFIKSVQCQKYPLQIGSKVITLNPTELAYLRGLSQGMTAKIIGAQDRISHRTVESRIDTLKEKFDVHTKYQLIEEFKKTIYWSMG